MSKEQPHRWAIESGPIKPEGNEVVLILEECYSTERYSPGDIVEDSSLVPSPLYILVKEFETLYGGAENFQVWTAEPYPLP